MYIGHKRCNGETHRNKHFSSQKTTAFLKGTVVNLTMPSLHGGYIEITLTVPLTVGLNNKNAPTFQLAILSQLRTERSVRYHKFRSL